jgi:small subunit ribosomal protein S8
MVTITDFLIRIKNASMAKNKNVETRLTKKTLAIAESLKKLGFLDEVKKEKGTLKVSLTFKNKRPLIMGLKLVSKPGLRVYIDTFDLAKKKSPSIFLISTPKGIISSKEALKLRVGGEVIAEIL